MKRREDGRIQKSIVINGQRKYFYGKTTAEVNKKILAYQDKVNNGRTFREVAEDWEEQHYPTLAPRTLSGYVPAAERAKEYFGDTPIRELRPRDIQKFINDFAMDGYAKKTVATQRLVINLICNYAVIEDDIEVNICASVRLPKDLPQTTRRCPTAEELRTVCDSVDAPFGLFAYFILFTGLRRGEALALRWDDIKNGLITVNKAVTYPTNQPLLKSTKTAAGMRLVVLPQCVSEKLPKHHTSPYLFPDADGGMMTEKHYERMWKDYQAATGLEITAHQLRHAYASVILREAGLDDYDTKELIGHADISTTRNIYTHMTEEHLRGLAKQINLTSF